MTRLGTLAFDFAFSFFSLAENGRAYRTIALPTKLHTQSYWDHDSMLPLAWIRPYQYPTCQYLSDIALFAHPLSSFIP